MGIKNESGEIVVGGEQGVVKARDYRQIADPTSRWNFAALAAMRGTPWQPNPDTNDEEIHANVRVPRDESVPSEFFPGQGEDRQNRRVRISPQDVKDCGLWINCPGCRAIRDNKSAANHTDECRNMKKC